MYLAMLDFIACSLKIFLKSFHPFAKYYQKIDVDSKFTKECKTTFDTLKFMLIFAPITQPPNSSVPFQIMCHASDFAVDEVWGQNKQSFICDLLCIHDFERSTRKLFYYKKRTSCNFCFRKIWFLFTWYIKLLF